MANSLATDQVQLQRAAASLQQEIAENRNRKTNLITASQAGTITTLTSQTGQTINGGQVLATLIPSTADAADSASLEAHPYAPSRTAGIVAKG
jgi:membrane fusion protein